MTYRANLASYPLTTKHDTSVPGSELLNVADFTANPSLLGTPATPFVNGLKNGSIQNSKLTTVTPISGATLLSGATNTDSIASNFGIGDTITVNGTPITFTASGGTDDATHIPIDSTITNLLGKIDGLTNNTTNPSSVSPSGVVTINTGLNNNLSLTTNNASALGALGFVGTVSASRTGGGTVGTGTVIGSDTQAFINESVSGGAVTAYDVSGSPVSLQFRWAKTDSATLGAGHSDTWNMFYQVDPNATGTNVAWKNSGVDFTFLPNGQMSPVVASVTLTGATVGGVALGDPTINFGSGGLTQFADANGNVQVNQIAQDGFPAGQLQTVSISSNGRVVGNYSNGRNIDLAAITLATFNGTNFLKRADGGAFEATDESGQALFGKGGTIVGSSLEGSNTDIADEFTKLIVTQQAYSANTKVITTSNQMVQDLLNVLR